jgi:UDP-N-acetylmuramoyl-tripeptide--D-alanyl-D-alanine ligase
VIPLELGEVCRLTSGRLADGAEPDARVTADVTIDSRTVRAGSLFVCLRGERSDGHDFAAGAVDAGAVAVVAERPVGVPAVVVPDAQAALGALARGVLERSGCRVVGVTGSSGKTSTKDLLAAVFAAAGPTVAPEGSFNNEIGLPLTALRVEESTETLVLEYSARGTGHIRYLCGIARPRIGIVLNVGAAHLGEFGSREAIATAKGELVEALPADGVAVLNADDPLVSAMAPRTEARVVTFGTAEGSDVRVVDLATDELARPSFRLETAAGAADVRLQLHGSHQALNAAAVVAAALAADIPLDTAVAALEATQRISAHRMHLRTRPDGLVAIDDAYNANPDSMLAAIAAVTSTAAGRRSWAVLGAMRELGPSSAQLHREVGEAAARAGLAEVVAVGADAVAIAEGAADVADWSGRARTVPDADGAVALLRAETGPDDVVLVKASNSERLWRVADALLDDSTTDGDRG